jgi:hypothetical protein
MSSKRRQRPHCENRPANKKLIKRHAEADSGNAQAGKVAFVGMAGPDSATANGLT